jgi:small subunit ribosomal protein S11
LLHVHTTSNNTIITLSDNSGNVIISAGAGRVGFKGTKESSAYASEMATKFVLGEAKNSCGLKEVCIICKGVGLGRDGAFKAVNELGGIDILWIKEATHLRFGGTKGKRPKRN